MRQVGTELYSSIKALTLTIASASLNNIDYLATSMELMAPPAKRGGGASGFGLNYDHETPLRAIDFGGADQGQRFDFSFHSHFFFSEHIFR